MDPLAKRFWHVKTRLVVALLFGWCGGGSGGSSCLAASVAPTAYFPAGFPAPAIPSGNPLTPAKIELGRHLFYDVRLSVTRTYSCASCHQQTRAFSDGKARAIGATGARHRHNAMAIINAAFAANLGWTDPRLTQIEDQLRIPLFGRDPVEMGLTDPLPVALVAQLQRDPYYRVAFTRAFATPTLGAVPRTELSRVRSTGGHAAQARASPSEALQGQSLIDADHVIKALAAFVRSIVSYRSPLDRRLFADDVSALSPAAQRGMRLFFSARTRCAQCHNGINLGGPVRTSQAPRTTAVLRNTGLYNVDGKGSYPAGDQGAIEHTHRPADMGAFRIPTLRNIALTAPYMHDGSLPTLDAVLSHYESGGHASVFVSSQVHAFTLTRAERGDLIAFLNALTDDAFVHDARLSDPWHSAISGATRGAVRPADARNALWPPWAVAGRG